MTQEAIRPLQPVTTAGACAVVSPSPARPRFQLCQREGAPLFLFSHWLRVAVSTRPFHTARYVIGQPAWPRPAIGGWLCEGRLDWWGWNQPAFAARSGFRVCSRRAGQRLAVNTGQWGKRSTARAGGSRPTVNCHRRGAGPCGPGVGVAPSLARPRRLRLPLPLPDLPRPALPPLLEPGP